MPYSSSTTLQNNLTSRISPKPPAYHPVSKKGGHHLTQAQEPDDHAPSAYAQADPAAAAAEHYTAQHGAVYSPQHTSAVAAAAAAASAVADYAGPHIPVGSHTAEQATQGRHSSDEGCDYTELAAGRQVTWADWRTRLACCL